MVIWSAEARVGARHPLLSLSFGVTHDDGDDRDHDHDGDGDGDEDNVDDVDDDDDKLSQACCL